MNGNHRAETAQAHETAYLLMMDALDGELANDSHHQLEAHLQTCSACQHEWQALQALEALFRQAPTLSPAADFAQRTIARLPNHRYRLSLLLVIYLTVLLGGTLPIFITGWLAVRLAPIFSEPTILNSLWQSITSIGQIAATVINALITGLGQFVFEQPAVLGGFLVLIGFIALWSGVMQQVVWQPAQWQR